MLRLFSLLTLPLLVWAGIMYNYIPPAAYPPPYYQDTYPYYYEGYGGHPAYYPGVGSGSAWAAGGGLLGNSLAFFLG